MVLFLFVVTLLPSGGRELNATGSRVAAGCVAGAALLVALAAAMAAGATPPPTQAAAPDLGVAAVGVALFSTLLVAFELTAPLLLVAVVGAVVIWRRHEPSPRTARPSKISEHRRLVMHR